MWRSLLFSPLWYAFQTFLVVFAICCTWNSIFFAFDPCTFIPSCCYCTQTHKKLHFTTVQLNQFFFCYFPSQFVLTKLNKTVQCETFLIHTQKKSQQFPWWTCTSIFMAGILQFSVSMHAKIPFRMLQST